MFSFLLFFLIAETLSIKGEFPVKSLGRWFENNELSKRYIVDFHYETSLSMKVFHKPFINTFQCNIKPIWLKNAREHATRSIQLNPLAAYLTVTVPFLMMTTSGRNKNSVSLSQSQTEVYISNARPVYKIEFIVYCRVINQGHINVTYFEEKLNQEKIPGKFKSYLWNLVKTGNKVTKPVYTFKSILNACQICKSCCDFHNDPPSASNNHYGTFIWI